MNTMQTIFANDIGPQMVETSTLLFQDWQEKSMYILNVPAQLCSVLHCLFTTAEVKETTRRSVCDGLKKRE